MIFDTSETSPSAFSPNRMDQDSLRVVVVGPVPPIRGGIAQHTGKLVEGMREAGHSVTVLTWVRQYPQWLYRSRQADPDGVRSSGATLLLRWWAPWTWIRAGLIARRHQVLVLPWIHPIQAVALRTVAQTAGRTATVAIVHNVRPHERFPGQRLATALFLGGVDAAVTQTDRLAEEVRELAPHLLVRTAQHPPNLDIAPQPLPPAGPLRLLFLGYVRPYKGLDILLNALVQLRGDFPDIRLTVAGELWEPDEAQWRQQIAELDLSDSVDLRPGYVPDQEISLLLARHHLVVAPYRTATQSGIIPLAQAAGRPVIVTPVGGLPQQVRDGVDGVVARDLAPDALAEAIQRGVAQVAILAAAALETGPTWESFARTTLEAALEPIAVKRSMTRGEVAPHESQQARREQWMERLAGLFRRRARPVSPRTERIALGLAVVVFFAAAIVAFLNLPDTERGIWWLPIVVAGVVGVPITLILNALEYQASGRALGHRIGIRQSLKVTIIGSAANLLPIPGSVIVRVRALSEMGSSYGQAVLASAAIGGLYVGVTILIAGLFQFAVAGFVLGAIWSLVGLGAITVGYGLLRRHAQEDAPKLAIRVAAIEGTLALTGALRLLLVLIGLGFAPGFSQAVALTVAGALTTAMGVFPAGLGMRELLVAGISPLVGLAATAGLTAAVVDRIFRFTIVGATAGVLVAMDRRRRDETGATDLSSDAAVQGRSNDH